MCLHLEKKEKIRINFAWQFVSWLAGLNLWNGNMQKFVKNKAESSPFNFSGGFV